MRYFIIRAMPTARATKAIMIIVQIVIGLRLLILTSLRSDALLRLRLLLINWKPLYKTKVTCGSSLKYSGSNTKQYCTYVAGSPVIHYLEV
jgi:hypothetical protein